MGLGSLGINVHNIRGFNFSSNFLHTVGDAIPTGKSAVTFGTGWPAQELLPELAKSGQIIAFPNEYVSIAYSVTLAKQLSSHLYSDR